MAILAVTVRLVESSRALLSPSERLRAGEAYFEVANYLLRTSMNRLDIRYILALYRWFPHFYPRLILGLTRSVDLALFAEGNTRSVGQFSLQNSEKARY